MDKEFCTYSQALRLKALGFDEPCFGFYDDVDKGFNQIHSMASVNGEQYSKLKITKAPTFSQAFRWFRETHELDGETARYNLSNSEAKLLGLNIKEIKFVYLVVINGEDFPELEDITLFMSREEAELACLDKLLEIVESKSE